MINMIKDYSDRTVRFATLLNAKMHFRGDVFKEDFKTLMMTVPLSFKGVVDEKFIRFANHYPNEIKLILVVYDNDDCDYGTDPDYKMDFDKIKQDIKHQEVIFVNLDEIKEADIDSLNDKIASLI